MLANADYGASQREKWSMGMNYTIILATVSFALIATTARAQDTRAPVASVELGGSSPSRIVTNVSENATDGANNITNQSNNPITPKAQFLMQNFFMTTLQGYGDRSADQLLLRLYLPFKLLGVQNIARIYQPIETEPLVPTGTAAGFGDMTVYDLALHKMDKFTVGAGPLLVLPVASHTNLGDGKWQAGAAVIAVTERSWGLMGSVVTYQHSFSGYGSSRPAAELVTVQPLIHYNFNHGYYLRSSGIWNLSFEAPHISEIPVGFGAGKVMKLRSGTVVNFYIEPQYSVYQNGNGSPKWQILTAVTFQFPNKQETELSGDH